MKGKKDTVKLSKKSTVQGARPLTQMITKEWHRFSPTPIEQEFLIPAMGNKTQTIKNQIIFKPKAVKQLKNAIEWGKLTPRNNIEQEGVLYGQVYETPNGIVGVVDEIYLLETTGDPAYIDPLHLHWFGAMKHLDELNKTRKTPLFQLGWWHTHPNNIGIFMSGTDKHTQNTYFNKDWQFAVVLCPQRQLWGAFIGSDAEPCDGYFLTTNVYKKKGDKT